MVVLSNLSLGHNYMASRKQKLLLACGLVLLNLEPPSSGDSDPQLDPYQIPDGPGTTLGFDHLVWNAHVVKLEAARRTHLLSAP